MKSMYAIQTSMPSYRSGNPEERLEPASFIADFRARHSLKDLQTWLERIRGLKVLVVGETIVDEYAYCTAIGKSSKEPILVINVTDSEVFAGGALAVANHLAGFVDHVSVVSMLGAQSPKSEFIRSALAPNVTPTFFTHSTGPTITKRRYIEKYFFQKLFEVYEMNDVIPEPDTTRFAEHLGTCIDGFDVVISVDFGHGLITPDCARLLATRSRFLAANAQSNAGNMGFHSISRYPSAHHISLTEKEIRLEMRDRHSTIMDLMKRLYERGLYQRIAVTRGAAGCLVMNASGPVVHIPAVADKVVDRVGAGDAFLALTAPLSAVGAPPEVLGLLGNAMGAEAVATVGNRNPVQPAQLTKRLAQIMEGP